MIVDLPSWDEIYYADAAGKEPYGDVQYSDPGFQPDKKKRYPVDTESHIRSAWNYIHKPHNASKYTSEQLTHIKKIIINRWKKVIDPKGPPSAQDSKGEAEAAFGNYRIEGKTILI